MRPLLLSLALTALPVAAAAPQQAEESSVASGLPTAAMRSCISNASPSLFTAVPVYLTFTASPSAPEAATGMLRLLVQDAAARVRLHLGAEPGKLPVADGKLALWDLDAAATVHLAGDGVARVTMRTAANGEALGTAAAREMLAAALRTAIDSGGPFVWSSSGSDTVRADVSLDHQGIGADGPLPLMLDFGVPVFSMRVPIETPVAQLPGAVPVYPPMARASAVEAEVLAHFVVDAEGRVDAGSFRAIRTRATAPVMEAQFVAAVRDVLPRLRFLPARIANCPVAQLVRQPFVFALH